MTQQRPYYPFLSLILRTLIGGILIYAGFTKALQPTAEFAALISAYKILPAQAVPLLTVALPYIEMWIGLFLMPAFFCQTVHYLATGKS